MAFNIRKSFDHKDDSAKGTVYGLSWMTAGKRTNEAGEEIDFYVPDVRELKQDDFEYYENRYKVCSSLFPKIEYGLLVYFGQATPFSKRNDFKSELGLKVTELANIHWDKSLERGEHNRNFQYYFRYLTLAFNIFQRARLTAELDMLCTEVINKHANWDVYRSDSLRGMLDLSSLMAENYSLFKNKVDFNDIVTKSLSAASELQKTYTWGAIYIVDQCISIRNKQNVDYKDLVHYKAELFEKMAGERTDKLVCLTFIENALRLYKIAKDSVKVAEMEAAYMTTRSQITLNAEFTEFPAEYVNEVTNMINEIIKTSDESTILSELMDARWFKTTAQIEAQAEVAHRGSIVPLVATTVIKDKFGNTVDKYITDDEGLISFNISGVGNYSINCVFDGDGNYKSTNVTQNVSVISNVVQDGNNGFKDTSNQKSSSYYEDDHLSCEQLKAKYPEMSDGELFERFGERGDNGIMYNGKHVWEDRGDGRTYSGHPI